MEALLDAALADPRVMLIVGDLGYSLVEKFAERVPGQYVNAGVAEQTMSGVAAGLALAGKVVFTYSIANFPTLRCLEQIRNDICYHKANVKIVAVGGGFAYGALGVSHHATEDLAIMRALPNMVVVAPGDPVEARLATRAVASSPGPCYLRLGRVGERAVHAASIAFTLGRALSVRDGPDVALVSTGDLLGTAVAVADLLWTHRCDAAVLSMHTLKPLDSGAIVRAARTSAALVTIEEHSLIGGLGSALAEVLAELDGPRVRFKRIGLPSAFASPVGDQAYLRATHGLSAEAIARTVLEFLASRDVRPAVRMGGRG